MVEYFLFCKDSRPPTIQELSATMRNAGWVVNIVRDALGVAGSQVVTEGELIENDVVFGWPPDHPMALKFETAVSGLEKKKLEKWAYDDELSSITWSTVASPFTLEEHSEHGSIENARENMGEPYAEFLAQTKCMYQVMYFSNMEFTAAAMGAVAMLRDGMIEDPQMGSVMFPPATAGELSNFLEKWS